MLEEDHSLLPLEMSFPESSLLSFKQVFNLARNREEKTEKTSFQGKKTRFSQCHLFSSDLSHLILRQSYKVL